MENSVKLFELKKYGKQLKMY